MFFCNLKITLYNTLKCNSQKKSFKTIYSEFIKINSYFPIFSCIIVPDKILKKPAIQPTKLTSIIFAN